jgi:hypothetical protein
MDNSMKDKLPILKHFESSEIGKSIDSFRKGEKGLFNIIKLIVFGGILVATWIYVVPPLFKALGQVIAIGGTLAGIVALILLAPVIVKALRRLTRFLHKMVIKHDPFGELEAQREGMLANKRKFQKAKGKITKLKGDMEISADQSEKNAHALSNKITKLKAKADKFKTEMEKMVSEGGVAAKGSDEYVQLHTEFLKVVSEAERKGHELKQEQNFVQKYGVRGAVMKKFAQKLLMVQTSMDIKILDFDATIEILKKDYAFAQESRRATDTAKDAMLFTEGWELEYAMDVVVSTIAEDIAITAGNLNDIDTLTSTYAMDSDELYDNLDKLANDINTGKNDIPSAKDYTNPEYKMTHSDKMASGGFGDVF